jgi:hypothetical protein
MVPENVNSAAGGRGRQPCECWNQRTTGKYLF